MPKAYVVGTFDTKAVELNYLSHLLRQAGIETVRIDLGTSGQHCDVEISASAVAAFHPNGRDAILSQSDRGIAVSRMALAFERMVREGLPDCGGIISAGGSGGTALAAPAMRALPVGVPKILVSTVASGNVSAYVGPADVMMMYSVVDVQGLNRISLQVLGNAAHALAGMISHSSKIWDQSHGPATKPAIGLTMFGVTTPCIQAVTKVLEDRFDCLVFHATGTGGQSMEKLVSSGLIAGVLDLTTTETADLVGGGIFSAGSGRMDVYAERPIPYVGSCGALDMVNFGAKETIPVALAGRLFHVHNPQVTLMRTSVEENRRMGEFIARKLNAMPGQVRFLLPEGGVSMLDAEEQVFHDQDANQALFETIELLVEPSEKRQVIRLPFNINDAGFAEAAVQYFSEIAA